MMRDIFKMQEKGRSMIEMLGVLAIVGVLSVGGIAGFNKAINAYKNNQSIDDMMLLLEGVLIHKDKFQQVASKVSVTYITESVRSLGIFPDGWKQRSGNGYLDKNGHQVSIGVRSNKQIVVVYRLAENEGKNKASLRTVELCQLMWVKLAKSFGDSLYMFWLWREGESLPEGRNDVYYGTPYCDGKRKCLSDLNLVDVVELCNRCDEGHRLCNIEIEIK
ncbi:MAG: hypothetical protein NC218_01235 [Acetobacter sp.]|nr:hypothetical protein [Acetobacter sp.]